eukprot:881334_1
MLRLLIIVNLAIFSVYLMANRLWAMRPYLLIHISIISMKWPINPKPHFRDYTIHVRGTFDFCNVDTSITTDRGLYLATKGYIHADSSLVRQGSIAFDSGTNGKGLFCNVLFENLNIAINTDRDGLASPYVVTVDNCEFSDIFRVFDGESFVGDVSLFTDSYFHNIDEVAYQSQATFQNCLFE